MISLPELVAVHIIPLERFVVIGLFLSINLINEILLVAIVIRIHGIVVDVGNGSNVSSGVGTRCHVVRSKEINIKSIIEEVVKRRIGEDALLRFTVASKELGVELTTVLLSEPVKIAVVQVDIGVLTSDTTRGH